MPGLGFRLDLSYIVSITIAAKFEDMKWRVWQSVGLACLVCQTMLLLRGTGGIYVLQKIFELLRLNLEVVVVKVQLNPVAMLATCSEYCN